MYSVQRTYREKGPPHGLLRTPDTGMPGFVPSPSSANLQPSTLQASVLRTGLNIVDCCTLHSMYSVLCRI